MHCEMRASRLPPLKLPFPRHFATPVTRTRHGLKFPRITRPKFTFFFGEDHPLSHRKLPGIFIAEFSFKQEIADLSGFAGVVPVCREDDELQWDTPLPELPPSYDYN